MCYILRVNTETGERAYYSASKGFNTDGSATPMPFELAVEFANSIDDGTGLYEMFFVNQ